VPGKIFALELSVPATSMGIILAGFKGEGHSRYAITIKVPESDLGPIVTHAVTHGIKMLSANPTGEIDTSPKGYVGGKRNKGISGRELIIALLSGDEAYGGKRRIWKGEELSKAFVANGFAGSSWSPPMSELIKADPPQVRALGKGMFCLIGLSLKPEDIPD
jgi:hypothetical protein